MLQARCNQLQKEALAGPAPRYLSFKAARTHVPAKAALINRVPAKLASVQHALNFPSMPKRCMRVKAAAAVSGLTEATPGKIKLGESNKSSSKLGAANAICLVNYTEWIFSCAQHACCVRT
eukprot:871099-Pelagomonas_calceolata.AAC.7